MSYPQQPGNWNDPSWSNQPPSQDPQQPGYDPQPAFGDPAAAPVSGQQPGYPASETPASGYPASGDPASGYPASGYPASGYPGPGYPGYGYPAAAPPTNGLAIASLVCSIAGVATCVTAPVGAVLGHVARKQIRERGEGGDGLALAGIIVGWIITALLLLVIVFYVVVIVIAVNSDGFDSSEFLLRSLTAAAG